MRAANHPREKLSPTLPIAVAAVAIFALLACEKSSPSRPKTTITESTGGTPSASPAASTQPQSASLALQKEVEGFLKWVADAHRIVEAGELKPEQHHPSLGYVSCNDKPSDKKLWDYGYCKVAQMETSRDFMWPKGKPQIWDASLVVLHTSLTRDCAALHEKSLGSQKSQYRAIHHCTHTSDQEILIDNDLENQGLVIHVFTKDYPLEKDPAGETPRALRHHSMMR